MKIKIRTKEGEFIADFPDALKIEGNLLTRLWPNGIEITEVIVPEWHGYEIIEQVSDNTEVTYPVQQRPYVESQFQIFNIGKNLTNEDEGTE
jgi:hypothetical protein